MTIHEKICCRIYQYDHSAGKYVETYESALNESSILSANIRRQCCPDDAFSIGGVYAATLSMQIRLPGMSLFQVRGAKVIVWSKYDTESDWYQLGTFWVTDATRTGEIFTLNAQDAVGWLDTSSFNDDSNVDCVGKVLYGKYKDVGMALESYGSASGWTQYLTTETNRFIQFQTGISNMLTWKRWNNFTVNPNEHYCNSHIWSDKTQYAGWVELSDPNIVFANGSDDEIDSETPRDLYKMLAQIMFGFIYAEPDGAMTLGQFGANQYETVEIGLHEMEYDSCDISDFELKMARAYVRAEYEDQSPGAWSALKEKDFSSNVYFHVNVGSNLFLDWMARGFSGDRTLITVTQGMWNWFYGFTDGAGVVHKPLHVRPFSCTVHSTKRFHLGQRIKLTYRDLHESAAHTYESMITSIQWTFRGGVQIACGGADSRVMADCLKASKGDKVRKEAQNRCRALEKRVRNLGG